MCEITNCYQLAWNASYQLMIVESDNKNAIPKGFGSGFVYQYKGQAYLITADHVLHNYDHNETCEGRSGKEDIIRICNNFNVPGELESVETYYKGGFYYEDMYSLSEIDGLQLTDYIDITSRKIDKIVQYGFFSRELRDCDGSIIVAKGSEKIIIPDCQIDDINSTDYYLICGCCCNDICGARLVYKNVVHQDLKYKETNKDGTILLSYDMCVKDEEWAGLSGSPVFNNRGKLVGMLTNASSASDVVTVIPICQVNKHLDRSMLEK